MRFKYQSEIESIPDCPPDDYKSQRLKAFRFVFEDTNHQNNFRPVLIIKPRRRKTGMFRRNTAKCQGYGLSFFDSLENAHQKYFKLIKIRPQLAKTLGTHIAEGVIDRTDGVVSKINREGHFTLHEFEQVDLKDKFSPVLEVYDNAKNKGNQGQ